MNNKKLHLRNIILIFNMILLLAMCVGCTAETGAEPMSQETVFQFGGKNVSLGEVYLYAYTVRDDYERLYGGDIWDANIDVADDQIATLEEATRKDIVEDIIRVKLLNLKAADYNVELKEEDLSDISYEAEKFWENMTDEQIKDLQLSLELVKQVISENVLANKVYEKLIGEAGIEVSAEDARKTTFFDMYFSCFTEGENGILMLLPEEERKNQYDRAIQAYNTLLSSAETGKVGDIETLADYYNLQYAARYTLSPEEIYKNYGEEIRDMLYGLEDGSFSLVTETENGYHIFYMISLTDSIATNSRRNRLKRTKEAEYFDTLYQKWIKEADPNFSYDDSVNTELYNRIEF